MKILALSLIVAASGLLSSCYGPLPPPPIHPRPLPYVPPYVPPVHYRPGHYLDHLPHGYRPHRHGSHTYYEFGGAYFSPYRGGYRCVPRPW